MQECKIGETVSFLFLTSFTTQHENKSINTLKIIDRKKITINAKLLALGFRVLSGYILASPPGKTVGGEF